MPSIISDLCNSEGPGSGSSVHESDKGNSQPGNYLISEYFTVPEPVSVLITII